MTKTGYDGLQGEMFRILWDIIFQKFIIKGISFTIKQGSEFRVFDQMAICNSRYTLVFKRLCDLCRKKHEAA